MGQRGNVGDWGHALAWIAALACQPGTDHTQLQTRGGNDNSSEGTVDTTSQGTSSLAPEQNPKSPVPGSGPSEGVFPADDAMPPEADSGSEKTAASPDAGPSASDAPARDAGPYFLGDDGGNSTSTSEAEASDAGVFDASPPLDAGASGRCAAAAQPLASGQGPRVLDVAAGEEHTCALLEGGSVRCWGNGSQGRLGYGDQRDTAGRLPQQLPAIELGGPATQIAAGLAHTCALLAEGSVRCWGDGRFGQLGLGDDESVGDDEVPAAVPALEFESGVRQIYAGEFTSCALLNSGVLQCWGELMGTGEGRFVEVGDGARPLEAGRLAVGNVPLGVSIGSLHRCSWFAEGGVRCWGEGSQGQLGYGNRDDVGDDELPDSVGLVQVGGSVSSVSAGWEHTCAVLADGNLQCWGRNNFSQIGREELRRLGDEAVPASLPPLAVGGRAREVVAADRFSCWLDDAGSVRCWGRNAEGAMGTGSTEPEEVTLSEACPAAVGAPIRKLVAGRFHLCGITETDSLICWGDGSAGQLGYGTRDSVGDDERPVSVGPLAF